MFSFDSSISLRGSGLNSSFCEFVVILFSLVGKWTFSSSSSLEESGAFLVGNVGISLVDFLFSPFGKV